MSFCQKEEKYIISGYSTRHMLTAEELYNRILQDSESDYNWFVPAKEILRVCKRATFPDKYAIAIKVAILNRFSSIANRANANKKDYCLDFSDRLALDYCYNSLYGSTCENAISARKKFLTEMILLASNMSSSNSDFIRLREEWRSNILKEYISTEYIDCLNIIGRLRANFIETINNVKFEDKVRVVDNRYYKTKSSNIL